jgi:hypothetical protein
VHEKNTVVLTFSFFYCRSFCVVLVAVSRSPLCSASSCTLRRNYHFPAPGGNCMTYLQALHDFPNTSQISLHKNNNINLYCLRKEYELNNSFNIHCAPHVYLKELRGLNMD